MITRRTDSRGIPATGIPAVDDCPSWCTNPGHVSETSREDQVCYSADTEADVSCSLSVEVDPNYGACYSIVSAYAYRAFNALPVVQLYVHGFAPHVDRTFELTAYEAAQLAEALNTAAALLGGGSNE